MARPAPRPPSPGSVEDVLVLLRASGARVTTSRRLLLGALLPPSAHRTAEDLAVEIQSEAPDVSLSTVYRNLEELERLGVVVHAHLGHGPAMYHLASAAHAHLVCEKCGATIELPEGLLSSLARAARTQYGFVVDPHHFAVLGRCQRCATPD